MSDIKTAIGSAIERHGKAAVLFSGGKESVVLAHLLGPFRDRVEYQEKWQVVRERLGVIQSAIEVELGHVARAGG